MNLLLSKKLRYFVLSMETRCINQAAEQLCITRTPLGRVLNELESHAGCKLFVRKYNKLEPTEHAFLLYEKVKPLYDTLCAIESEFNQRSSSSYLELLFDVSVPYILYQYLISSFKAKKYPIVCRRVSVFSDEIRSLSTKPGTALLSYRKIAPHDDVKTYQLGEEGIVVILPEHIHDELFEDFEVMKGVILYIHKDEYFGEIKGFITHLLKSHFPYLDIHETESDLSAQLFSISAGEGMLPLPEHLAPYFDPPRTRKVKLPDIKIQSLFYINKKFKDIALVDKIMEEISLYR